jgi:transposase-like protein
MVLTSEQEQDLLRLSRAHKTPRKLAERAAMILLSAGETPVREIARRLGVWPKTVRHWRARWLTSPEKASVATRLADAPRPGTPATFAPEQVCATGESGEEIIP